MAGHGSIGRYGDGEGAKRSWSKGNRKWNVCHWEYLENRRPQNSLPQKHTSSNKATPTPTKPHLLIVLFPMGAIFLQTTRDSLPLLKFRFYKPKTWFVFNSLVQCLLGNTIKVYKQTWNIQVILFIKNIETRWLSWCRHLPLKPCDLCSTPRI